MKRSLNQINPEGEHQSQQGCLRTGGFLLIIIGGIFTLIGLGSFFSSFGSFGAPKYFWCAFVGLPMVGIGTSMLKFGYLGKITRYVAQEAAPPAKDTFNYLAEHTKSGVKSIAQGISEGMNQEDSEEESKSIEERLIELKQLKQKGFIDEADYQKQKSRILSEL